MMKKLPPLVRLATKLGLQPKSNGVPGKYLVGYKLARKMKRAWIKFLIENCHRTASEGRSFYYDQFQIDWENPYTLSW